MEMDRRLRVPDVLAIAYLLLTVPLLLAHPVDRPRGFVLAFLHVAAVVLIYAGRAGGLHRRPLGRFLLDFYPVALFAAFYSEVGFLNQAIFTNVFFDEPIIRWEERLFGNQPSRDWRVQVPGRGLGEYLHAGYVSYYFLVPVLALFLWFRRQPIEYEKALGCISLVFYLCFICFILLPVAGPYYNFAQSPPETVGYVLPHFTRWLLNSGSSVGAAFPSSHVAVSVTAWIMAMRYYRKLAVVYLFLVPALAMGAVYLGFHYLIDALAGAALAVLVGTWGHGLVESLAWRLRRRDSARIAISPARPGRG
jgi:membrane-associated phospholipid phosphatase